MGQLISETGKTVRAINYSRPPGCLVNGEFAISDVSWVQCVIKFPGQSYKLHINPKRVSGFFKIDRKWYKADMKELIQDIDEQYLERIVFVFVDFVNDHGKSFLKDVQGVRRV